MLSRNVVRILLKSFSERERSALLKLSCIDPPARTHDSPAKPAVRVVVRSGRPVVIRASTQAAHCRLCETKRMGDAAAG